MSAWIFRSISSCLSHQMQGISFSGLVDWADTRNIPMSTAASMHLTYLKLMHWCLPLSINDLPKDIKSYQHRLPMVKHCGAMNSTILFARYFLIRHAMIGIWQNGDASSQCVL